MKLRTQLILAFLLLAVLPLATIVLYSYNSSQRALRRAAEVESERLASDLGSRMQEVSEDLNRRLGHLGGLPFRVLMAQGKHEANEGVNALVHQLMAQMGDTASFIDALEFTPSQTPVPEGGRSQARQLPVPPQVSEGQRPSGFVFDFSAAPPATGTAEMRPRMEQGRMTWHIEVPPSPPSPPPPPATRPEIGKDTPAFANKKQAELERNMVMQAEAMHTTAMIQASKALEVEKQLRLARGKLFDTEVRSGGELVGSLRAEVSTQRVLGHVLSRTQRTEGEIPFAVDTDGKILAADPADIPKIESLPLPSSLKIQRDTRKVDRSRNWVIATRRDERSGVVFGIARPIGDRLEELRRTAARNLTYGLGIVVLALIGIVPLSGRMTRNLRVLTEEAEQLAQGNLHARVNIESKDEFGQLARAFNRMAQDLSEHEKNLVERERLQKELEMCRQIQEELLPRHALRSGVIEVKGVSIPAREVGGDFFNYFPLPNGDVAVLVGDVSGKGLPAALLMANLQATIQARLPLELDLARLAAQLDAEIAVNTPAGLYLTLFIAVLETRTHALRYVNAGHNTQFALRAGGSVERLESTGRPLGLLPGGSYVENRVILNDGDCLFCYTDGLVETENEAEVEFGMDRLEALIVAERENGPQGIMVRVEEEIRRYRGNVEVADDATMMLLRVGLPA